ncbi:hypothetical protein ACFRAR_28460 [Kitasatospora sp. NPDC056651]|uniref:hypothetical protein n=1 Tax=Kitasatospora sp. NPDC056651 TaxID=3345892 RepID=UPI0036AD54FB
MTATVARARREGHPVYQLLDGTVRIGQATYTPVPAAPVELHPDHRGEFPVPGGLSDWWVHEVSSDRGHTWQRLEGTLLLHENRAKRLFVGAAEFGQPLTYDPPAGQATGTLIDNEPGSPMDRFTRLVPYLPDPMQVPNWRLTVAPYGHRARQAGLAVAVQPAPSRSAGRTAGPGGGWRRSTRTGTRRGRWNGSATTPPSPSASRAGRDQRTCCEIRAGGHQPPTAPPSNSACCAPAT